MKISRTNALLSMVLAALGSTHSLAQTPAAGSGLISERSISVNTALELAHTSLERCRTDG